MSAETPNDFPVAARIGASGYAVDIDAAGHRLRGDEPESAGGANTGPDPYAMLLASLGTCTAMTLRMYADRKQWPLDGATITLRHRRIHAKDCADCETTVGKVSRIDRVVELEGDLSDEQRERLMEIADKCPVHRTLEGEIVIGPPDGD